MLKIMPKDMRILSGAYTTKLVLHIKVEANCQDDNYLWLIYWWSRPSFLKTYRCYMDGGVEMVEYRFPIWWQQKIIDGMPQELETKWW